MLPKISRDDDLNLQVTSRHGWHRPYRSSSILIDAYLVSYTSQFICVSGLQLGCTLIPALLIISKRSFMVLEFKTNLLFSGGLRYMYAPTSR
ncbi:hypothetical protein BDR04DRAFT_517399 [Suillus decipiens]|nr:hypothetical protein BDR04DRAFT_517399 [Suillus decipiens]